MPPPPPPPQASSSHPAHPARQRQRLSQLALGRSLLKIHRHRSSEQGHRVAAWRRSGGWRESPDASSPHTGKLPQSPSCWVSGWRDPGFRVGAHGVGAQPLEARGQQPRRNQGRKQGEGQAARGLHAARCPRLGGTSPAWLPAHGFGAQGGRPLCPHHSILGPERALPALRRPQAGSPQ